MHSLMEELLLHVRTAWPVWGAWRATFTLFECVNSSSPLWLVLSSLNSGGTHASALYRDGRCRAHGGPYVQQLSPATGAVPDAETATAVVSRAPGAHHCYQATTCPAKGMCTTCCSTSCCVPLAFLAAC